LKDNKITKNKERKMNKRKQQTIEEIARKELLIETLETRYSDSLDFHECSVVGVKAALTAAYEAGRKAGKVAATPKQASPYDWEDINKAMMATGHSPLQIWRFLRALKDISKGA
jgi:hypothetical protein